MDKSREIDSLFDKLTGSFFYIIRYIHTISSNK